MNYDPIKASLNRLIGKNRFFRKFFYICLDLFILRQWYIKKAIAALADIACHSVDNKENMKTRDKMGYAVYKPNYTSHKKYFLDAGAGFCQYSDFVLNRYKDAMVIAVDIKTDFLKTYASSLQDDATQTSFKKRFSYIEANLEKFVLGSSSMHSLADTIIAIDILEHIEDDVAVLGNFYDSMTENGYLIIHTPSSSGSEAAFAAEHVRAGYSLCELKEKIQNAGFEVVSHRYTYGFWGNIHWHLVMKNSMLMAGFSKILIFLLPLYLLLIFVPSIFCIYLDLASNNKKGKGILLIGKKI